jgi:2-C-methyl-D-erythritol 4-phosphate cytidylyltransferase/2-C-methyl-D-erythritol 2,4-cyclodiphosphate synthase
MKVVAAVLAAGKGERFGAEKTVAPLGGKPLWRWSFEALIDHPAVAGVGIVCAPEQLDTIRGQALGALFCVAGGATRKKSSARVLAALPEDADLVLIHDGARPFVSQEVVRAVIDAAARSGAAAPGFMPTDTIKVVGKRGLETLDRGRLVAVQTPQGLLVSVFRKGHELLEDATDDLALAEAAGVIPEIVPGDPDNIKITTPKDLLRAEALLSHRAGSDRRPLEFRTGIGYDIHSFSVDPSRSLWLGGVRLDDSKGLEGHSDADALLHAMTDALLGAAALGDIGTHFPNTDSRWKGEPSASFLAHAAHLVRREGWTIANVDATLLAEAPRMSPHVPAMRRRIAEVLGIELGRISLKATTNERLGSIGRGEGIAAIAIATLSRPA